jgi:PadR family transcriptional regulator
MRSERLKGHLDLLLLQVLAAGPAHGYEVIVSLRERSDGEFDVPEGTVYPALHHLEDRRLLSSEWVHAGGRRRRMYRLTPEGQAALRAAREQWRQFSGAVQAVLGAPA